MLRRYADGVFVWSRFQADRGYEFNGTALQARGREDGGTVLLVDPVATEGDERDTIRSLGSRFFIVLTNADHERQAADLSKHLAAPVLAPAADVPLLKMTGVSPLPDGAELPGGWIVKTLSGMKTPGESVLFHAGRRLLVIGDAVIGDPVTGLRMVPATKLADRAKAIRSVSSLLQLDFVGMILGDGFVLPKGGKAALAGFLEREAGRGETTLPPRL